MQQVNKYIVTDLGTEKVSILTEQDASLVDTFQIASVPFRVGKYTLDLSFYDLNQNYIETVADIETYSVLGKNQVNEATEITVNPVQDCLDNGYLGDVVLKYKATNNLFSETKSSNVNSNLYVVGISVDRTELRTKAPRLTDEQVSKFVDSTRRKLVEGTYFPEIYLDFFNSGIKSVVTNVTVERVGTESYVTFKLYQPLSDEIIVKDQFYVQEKVGDIEAFRVVRDVEILPEAVPQLSEPNFSVSVEDSNVGITDYVGYGELLSYPLVTSNMQLYSICQNKGVELGIDYTDYRNFIQFSSAVERLENFRYKLTLIESYREAAGKIVSSQDRKKYETLIQGIVQNFDHYERFLYFENSEKSWPKTSVTRPYKNMGTEEEEAIKWWKKSIEEARSYDENNPSILINSIPLAIREDSSNEPYIVFVHMIGQHFDNEWVYAKAISSRYDGDNRLDRGISKDLVWKAIASFGLEICKSNRNLEELFNRCKVDGTYDKGDELSVIKFKRISSEEILDVIRIFDGEYAPLGTQVNVLDGTKALVDEIVQRVDGKYAGRTSEYKDNTWQPILIDNYRKEVYKRIYHNIPILLKSKGTNRGLRTLINCFGIPDNILTISFQKRDTPGNTSYFGPETETSSTLEKVKILTKSNIVPSDYAEGTFRYTNQLDENTSVVTELRAKHGTSSNNLINIGFDITKQFDTYVQDTLTSFNYDSIIGDSRNEEENYGNAFDPYVTDILQKAAREGITFRSPAGIIRLVKYIDTAFYRSIRDFISARDRVTMGVVVKDNILHRNRYAGLKQSASETEILEGKTDKLCKVSGSSGESFNVTEKSGSAGTTIPEMNYKQPWSTNKKVGIRNVTDGSARYTGEIQGSDYKVVDGELIKNNVWHNQIYNGNPYAQAGFNASTYTVKFNFLCLPAVPTRTFSFVASNVAKRINVYSTDSACTLNYNYCRSFSTFINGSAHTSSPKTEIQSGDSKTENKLIVGNAASTMFNRASSTPLPVGTSESALMYRQIRQLELEAIDPQDKDVIFLGWYRGKIGEGNTQSLIEDFICTGRKVVINYEDQDLDRGFTARYFNLGNTPEQALHVIINSSTETEFKFRLGSKFPEYSGFLDRVKHAVLTVTLRDRVTGYVKVFTDYLKQEEGTNLDWTREFSAPQFCNAPEGSEFEIQITSEELPTVKYAYFDGALLEVNWNQ